MIEYAIFILLLLIFLTGIALLVLRVRQYRTGNRVTEEEVISVIQEGTRSGEVQEVEQDIMERVLAMGDLKVDSLMTHRSELVTLDVNMGVGQVENVIRRHPYAAYPVVIISLKDILEGLVGSIDMPTETPNITERSDGRSWVVSGQCSFYDFINYFDMEEHNTSADFTTVGGLILDQLERIPEEGDSIAWADFSFRVLKMDENRIVRILVKRI